MISRSDTYRVLNLEPDGYCHEARAILERFSCVDDGPLSRAMLLEKISAYDALIVRLGHQIDAEVMSVAPRLKIIVTATTGLNHIDVNEAQRRKIKILSLKGEQEFLNNIHATAEHTWALMLALARKIPKAHEHVLSRQWNRDDFKGCELHGKTLGVVGMGRLGTKVAGYGICFGMAVIGYDTIVTNNLQKNIDMVSFRHVLTESDIITIHVNYTEKNRYMFSSNEFSQMKKKALLINTSRGELIDETALVHFLSNGYLGGAALDVLCQENSQTITSQLLIEYAIDNQNLIITPHIGGCTHESMNKTEIFMAEKFFRYKLKEDNN